MKATRDRLRADNPALWSKYSNIFIAGFALSWHKRFSSLVYLSVKGNQAVTSQAGNANDWYKHLTSDVGINISYPDTDPCTLS